MAYKEKLWYINTMELFKGLSKKDMEEFSKKLNEHFLKKKSYVYDFNEDPLGEKIYIIKEGKVKISRVTTSGKELTIDILGPSDMFGTIGKSLKEDENVNLATALEDTFICSISKKDFESFVSIRPSLSFKVTKWLDFRLRRIETRFEDMIFQDVPERLLTVLMDLKERYGLESGKDMKLNIKLSHQELANLIGSSRETVTLEMKHLKEKGKIKVIDKYIYLPK